MMRIRGAPTGRTEHRIGDRTRKKARPVPPLCTAGVTSGRAGAAVEYMYTYVHYRSYANALSAAIGIDNGVWRFVIDWVLLGWADLPRAFERSGYAKFIYLHRILRGSLAQVGFYLLD